MDDDLPREPAPTTPHRLRWNTPVTSPGARRKSVSGAALAGAATSAIAASPGANASAHRHEDRASDALGCIGDLGSELALEGCGQGLAEGCAGAAADGCLDIASFVFAFCFLTSLLVAAL